MTIKSKLLAGSILAALASTSMANMVTLNPNIHGFNQIDLANMGTAIVRQGNHDSIKVQVSQRLAPYMNIYKSSGNTLNLTINDHPFHVVQKPIYYITVRHLQALRDRNTGIIKVQTPVHTQQMSIVLNNSGHINIPSLVNYGVTTIYLHNSGGIHINQLRSAKTNINLANSGQVTINHLQGTAVSTFLRNSGHVNLMSGRVVNQTVNVRNSGTYVAKNVFSNHANVIMHNSGSVTLTAHNTLGLQKRNGGQLFVFGSPKITKLDVRNSSGIHIK